MSKKRIDVIGYISSESELADDLYKRSIRDLRYKIKEKTVRVMLSENKNTTDVYIWIKSDKDIDAPPKSFAPRNETFKMTVDRVGGVQSSLIDKKGSEKLASKIFNEV